MATVEQLRTKQSEFNSKIYRLQQVLIQMEEVAVLLPKESHVGKTKNSILKLIALLQEAKLEIKQQITKKNRNKYYHLKTNKIKGESFGEYF